MHEIQNIFNINMVNFKMGKLGFYFTNISISAYGNQRNPNFLFCPHLYLSYSNMKMNEKENEMSIPTSYSRIPNMN